MKNNILLSEPFLNDPNFTRAVILLCEHNEEGAMGLVLNKPTEITIGEVVPDLQDFEDIIYIGGPVAQNTLHFIHRYSERIAGDILIADGLYWGGNFKDMLSKLIEREIGTEDIRFFLGYSGWTNPQLEQELSEKSWIESQSSLQNIFEQPPQDLWSKMLKNMGGKFREIANYPIDPRLN